MGILGIPPGMDPMTSLRLYWEQSQCVVWQWGSPGEEAKDMDEIDEDTDEAWMRTKMMRMNWRKSWKMRTERMS
ncbi:hypothetical protein A0H81_13514 [Grifola frondosa]|uniref:Uncharacterized protein n=1 Tax=Grifola frondosa TaxID=5627 RepID=A0A1C7LPG4_GRIFR|nr:hypothetical protein A0H81_13514 [Grifola frondosa]